MPDHLSPAQRSLLGQLGAHALHASIKDPAAHTAPARKAFLDRFEKAADPDEILPDAERARRAEHLRRAHMAKLSLAAATARRRKASAPKASAPADDDDRLRQRLPDVLPPQPGDLRPEHDVHLQA